MMPHRLPYNKSAGSGNSMYAAVVVTAVTCNQNEQVPINAPTISQDDSTELVGGGGK